MKYAVAIALALVLLAGSFFGGADYQRNIDAKIYGRLSVDYRANLERVGGELVMLRERELTVSDSLAESARVIEQGLKLVAGERDRNRKNLALIGVIREAVHGLRAAIMLLENHDWYSGSWSDSSRWPYDIWRKVKE